MYSVTEMGVCSGWRYELVFRNGNLLLLRLSGKRPKTRISFDIGQNSVTVHFPRKPDIVFYATSEVADDSGPCRMVPVILDLFFVPFCIVFRINIPEEEENPSSH